MDSVWTGDDPRLPSAEPVGRVAEIARLHAVVAGLSKRRGAVVEIAGDPGVGKSALLEVLAARARSKGAAVYRARALDRPTIPYQVFRDTWAIRPVTAEDEDAPDLPAPDAGDDARFRFGRAVLGRLARLAETQATMLVLDDVHLCDAASAELLAQLVRTPVPGAFVLALAHRPRQTPPALLDALTRTTAGEGSVRMEPRPLDEESFDALVAGWRLPEPADPELYEAAGGNPHYAEILARAGWRADDWPDHSGTSPDRLLRAGSILVAELARLDAAASAVALAAAVLGDTFASEDLACVAALPAAYGSATATARPPADGVLDALARLASRDVVRPLGGGGQFAFRHPLLRHIILERAPATARRAAHHRAFDLLSGHGAAKSALARQIEYALRPGDLAAVRVLVEAADEAITDAPTRAARWLELALDAIGPQAEPPDELGLSRDALTLSWSRALRAAGRPARARALAHRVLAHQVPRPSEEAEPSEAYELWVGAERDLGHYDEAEAVATAVLAPLLEARQPRLPGRAAALAVEYGKVVLLRGEYSRVQALVRDTIEAAHRAGDAQTELSARTLSAFGHVYLGDAAAAASAIASSARLIDGLHDGAVARDLESVTLLGWGEFFTERFTDAARHLERGLGVARATGRRHAIPLLLLGVARTVQLTGRADTTQDLVRVAYRLARAQGAHDVAGLALAIDAAGRMWSRGRGETKQAVALAEEAVSVAAHGKGWWLLAGVEILAQGRLLDGDPDGCLRDLLHHGGGRDLPLIFPTLRPICHSMLAEAALQAGYPRAARRWSKQATAQADALNLPMKRMFALRTKAAILAADGRHDSAARMYQRAADGFRRVGVPVRQAWTLAQGARAAELSYGPAIAAHWLERSAKIAQDIGAARIVDEARLQLDGLTSRAEVTAHTTVRTDALSTLTQRERQIALLAGRGERTRDIADELYLSPRTVDAHLARIYRKLNVSSRIALAGLILAPVTAAP